MIIDFRLEIFKVEGKRYIICSNHEILFMLFRPLVLYRNAIWIKKVVKGRRIQTLEGTVT